MLERKVNLVLLERKAKGEKRVLRGKSDLLVIQVRKEKRVKRENKVLQVYEVNLVMEHLI